MSKTETIGFRDAHLSDKTTNKHKEVITIKVGVVATFGGREGLCWDEAREGVTQVLAMLFLDFSDR